jgi:hypothetical protein
MKSRTSFYQVAGVALSVLASSVAASAAQRTVTIKTATVPSGSISAVLGVVSFKTVSINNGPDFCPAGFHWDSGTTCSKAAEMACPGGFTRDDSFQGANGQDVCKDSAGDLKIAQCPNGGVATPARDAADKCTYTASTTAANCGSGYTLIKASDAAAAVAASNKIGNNPAMTCQKIDYSKPVIGKPSLGLGSGGRGSHSPLPPRSCLRGLYKLRAQRKLLCPRGPIARLTVCSKMEPGAKGTDLNPLSPAGPPVIFNFSEIRVLPTPKMQGEGNSPSHLDYDYQLNNYFMEARDIGRGPAAAHMSFTEAIRRFII